MKTDELNNTLDTYQRDGVVIMNGLLDAELVTKLRQEGEALRETFHDKYGSTSPIKTRGGWRLDIPPVNLVRSGGAPMAKGVGEVMNHPLIQASCDAILGSNWHATALVFDYRAPTGEPLPEESFQQGYPPAYYWHVDHGNPGLASPNIFTLRFQIYLNDTDFERGALGYVRGSQRLVKYARKRLHEEGYETHVIDTRASLITACEQLRQTKLGIAPEYEQLLTRFIDVVPQYDYADRQTACEGGAGTVLMFDDTGMHRGNFVDTDHRFICRILCMPINLKSRFGTWTSAKNSFARLYYKNTLNEPYVSLL